MSASAGRRSRVVGGPKAPIKPRAGSLPTGTVTFLFTDIQGSTQLLQRLGPAYGDVLMTHHAIIRHALTVANGTELSNEGDAFMFVFASAVNAALGAADAQRALQSHPWADGAQPLVRMGLHTGEASLQGRQYIGLDVHRAARIAAAAHGGQVLLSQSACALVESSLPPELHLRDLGQHRLKDLNRLERIFQLEIDGVPCDFPALRSLEARPNNLPTQLTSFVGREAELAQAHQLLQRTRLLTLTGPGGTGKTRLALQLAAEMLDEFPGGVYFVGLAAIRDPELIPSAIAQALAVTATGTRSPQEALVEYLHDKRLLIVMDNFEQLLPGAAQVVELLERCPGLTVVVTSRAILHVTGEQEDPIPPLRLPSDRSFTDVENLLDFEAIQLFFERASTVKPEFRIVAENAATVVSICRRLDGLPLAIELAAARVKLFSPSALLARLDNSLALLATAGHDLPERRQTLRGTIAWSADLLDESHRRLLARFSVFARGANLEQAETVCGPDLGLGVGVLDGLDQLADQSLIRRVPEFDQPRFMMLQVIREFALERLDRAEDASAVHQRHAGAYLDMVARAQPHLERLEKDWLDRLERDHDNIRTALEWFISQGEVEQALRLVSSIWRFWQMRGHLHEGRSRLDWVLALPADRVSASIRKQALEAAGGIAYWQADLNASKAYYDQVLELSRISSDPAELANALYNAAFPTLVSQIDLDRAKPRLEEAATLYLALKDQAGIARVRWAIGIYFLLTKDYQAAVGAFDESRDVSRSLNRPFDLAWALALRGLIAIGMGDVAEAKANAGEALQLFRAANDVSGMVMLLGYFSGIASLTGDGRSALLLDEAAAVHRATTGAELGMIARTQIDWPQLPPTDMEVAADARLRGKSMSLEEAVDYALDLVHRSRASAAD